MLRRGRQIFRTQSKVRRHGRADCALGFGETGIRLIIAEARDRERSADR